MNSGNLFIYPAINVLLKINYRHDYFGKLYNYATSLNKIIMLIVTFAYGLLLDADNFAFTFVFPVIGVLGVISLFVLSQIDYSRVTQQVNSLPFLASVRKSWVTMITILKINKPCQHFEIGFMFYGFSLQGHFCLHWRLYSLPWESCAGRTGGMIFLQADTVRNLTINVN